MAKVKIDAHDVVHDIRAGLNDTDLMRKYKLTAKGLQSLRSKLFEHGLITREELGQEPVQTISAREAMRDVRAGLDDFALMKKYDLSPKGLQSLLNQLVKSGALSVQEVEGRMPSFEETVALKTMAPDAPGHAPIREIEWECPQCGIRLKRGPKEQWPVCPVCLAIVETSPQEGPEATKKSGRAVSQEDRPKDMARESPIPTPAPRPIMPVPVTPPGEKGPDAGDYEDRSDCRTDPEKSGERVAEKSGPIEPDEASDSTVEMNWVCPSCGVCQESAPEQCPICDCLVSELESGTSVSAQPPPGEGPGPPTGQSAIGPPAKTTANLAHAAHDAPAEQPQDALPERLGLSAAIGQQRLLGTIGGRTPPESEKTAVYNEIATSLLAEAARMGNSREVRRLLNKGADPNGRDPEGQTPLVWASTWGFLDVIQVLMEHGADVNLPTDDGETPLMCAASMGHLDAMGLLRSLGAR